MYVNEEKVYWQGVAFCETPAIFLNCYYCPSILLYLNRAIPKKYNIAKIIKLMALHIHTGNKLGILTDKMAEVFDAPLSRPLAQEIIVVPS